MAATVVQIDDLNLAGLTLARLAAAEVGLVTPSAAGYTVDTTGVSSSVTITVAEACTGMYRITLEDSDGIEQLQGWVWIQDDDTATYNASGSLHELLAYRLQFQATNALIDIGADASTAASESAIAATQSIIAANESTTAASQSTIAATQSTEATAKATIAASEVVKIHRAETAVTAGGHVTRTKVSATESTLVETLS